MSGFSADSEDYWIPLADIMTGLMLIFMLIAVSYMLKVSQNQNRIQAKLDQKSNVSKMIYTALVKEFHGDLGQWQASIDPKSLSVNFNAPNVLFDTGKADLKPGFVDILNNFFPRYVNVLKNKQYANNIAEIRINGYASSTWGNNHSEEEVFFNNMHLSQQRSDSVFRNLYTRSTPTLRQYLREHISANGFSSSHVVLNQNGTEDAVRSQRVEFKVILN